MKRFLSLLLVMLLTIAAVGSIDSETLQVDPNSEVEQSATNTSENDTITFRYGIKDSWPDSKHPYLSTLSISQTFYHDNIYQTLLGQDQDLNTVGRLAEAWDVSKDGLTWTFNLRKGVKWHDGEDFNADDVVYSYKVNKDMQLPRYYSCVKDFIKINKVDNYTVQFKTEDPKVNIMDAMIDVVPEHIFGQYDTKEKMLAFTNEHPIGTGSFVFVEDAKDEYVKYKANDDYWDGRPVIDELIYVYFTNSDSLIQALEKGEIDFCGIGSSQIPYVEALPNITMSSFNSIAFNQLGFNCWKNPVSKGNPLILDVKLRVAINYAINYDKIIEYAIGGLGMREYSLLPTVTGKWHWEPSEEQKRGYDPEKAKQLLEEAGYKDTDRDGIREDSKGNKLVFRFSVIEARYKDTALIIEQNLKDVGIKTIIEYMDEGRLTDLIYCQDFNTDMYLWGWFARYSDPTHILSAMTTEQIKGRSDCYFSDDEYDKLYELQSKTVDEEERLKIIYRMQEIIYEDCPYIILYSAKRINAYDHTKWENFQQWPRKDGNIFNYYTKLKVSSKDYIRGHKRP